MNIDGFEIERKFLIAMPDPAVLERGERSRIVQTYLLGQPDTTERVRLRAYPDRTEYTHTVKTRLNAMRRIENERAVSAAEYEELLTRADPARRPIEKERCCIEEKGLIWEVDIFPFWKKQAYLEVELLDESQPFVLPPWVTLLRDVTEDPRYTNAALAFQIPEEEK